MVLKAILIYILALVCMAAGLAGVAALGFYAQGTWLLPAWFAAPVTAAERTVIAVYISFVLGAFCSLLLFSVYRSQRDYWSQRDGVARKPAGPAPGVQIAAVLSVLWLIAALIVADVQAKPLLFPMAAAVPLAAASAYVATRTAMLLGNGDEKIEIRHDIVGLGGGLGSWRMTRSAAGALLALLLAGTALGLATVSLPRPAEDKTAAASGTAAAEAPPPKTAEAPPPKAEH